MECGVWSVSMLLGPWHTRAGAGAGAGAPCQGEEQGQEGCLHLEPTGWEGSWEHLLNFLSMAHFFHHVALHGGCLWL